MEKAGRLNRDELIKLIAATFERAAERLRAESQKDSWPEDLRVEDIVRILQERSRQVIVRVWDC